MTAQTHPTRRPTGHLIAESMTEVVRRLVTTETVQGALDEIAAVAVGTFADCDYAGGLLVDPRGDEIRGHSGRLPDADEQALRELDCGPPSSAVDEPTIVHCDDLASDSRWPQFAKRAVSLGLTSAISYPFVPARGSHGRLTVYSRIPAAFDADTRHGYRLYAEHAGAALANFQVQVQLRQAMETRGQIGEAIGMIMARQDLTSSEAFDVLVNTSQNLNLKLREVAALTLGEGEWASRAPGGRRRLNIPGAA